MFAQCARAPHGPRGSCPRAGVTGSEREVALQEPPHTWAPPSLGSPAASGRARRSSLPVSAVGAGRRVSHVRAGGWVSGDPAGRSKGGFVWVSALRSGAGRRQLSFSTVEQGSAERILSVEVSPGSWFVAHGQVASFKPASRITGCHFLVTLRAADLFPRVLNREQGEACHNS